MALSTSDTLLDLPSATVQAVRCGVALVITVAGFGTSNRRGQRGWSDAAMVRQFLGILEPDYVGHGASPSDGADKIIDVEAEHSFIVRGLDPWVRIKPYPVDTALDGPWPRAGMTRNGRMLDDLKPTCAAGFVTGRVGERVGSKGCYLTNGSDNMARRCREAKVPLVIFREDGVEPYASKDEALDTLRELYLRTEDRSFVESGKALAVHIRGGVPASEVIEKIRGTETRFAAWLAAVEQTLHRHP